MKKKKNSPKIEEIKKISMRERFSNWKRSRIFIPVIVSAGSFSGEIFDLYRGELLKEGIFFDSVDEENADLLIIIGSLNHLAANKALEKYKKLKRGKFVLHLTSSARLYENEIEYNTVSNLSDLFPVDASLRGAPPCYEDFRNVLLSLKVRN